MGRSAGKEAQVKVQLAKPEITRKDRECVDVALRSGRLSLGPWTERFEDAVAKSASARYAIATCNGTAGLVAAIKCVNEEPFRTWYTSAYSFIASANAITLAEHDPVLVDIDLSTWMPRNKVDLSVDLFGMEAPPGFIQDSCEAIGTRLRA